MRGILAVTDQQERYEDAVAIACDANFHPYAAFLAWQLAVAHPDRKFDIVIASEEPLPRLPLLEKLHVRHLVVDTGSAFGNFSRDARRTFATYLWLLLPDVTGYRRVLALDADIFHARGDVGEVFGMDLGGRARQACRA